LTEDWPIGNKLSIVGLEELLVRARDVADSMQGLRQSIAEELDLTGARWAVLAAAASRRSSVARHARALGLARQSVQRTADLLVERGLARFEANPDHRRSPLLVPTPTGAETVASLERMLVERLSSVAELVDAEEIESAALTLQTVRDEIASQV
jgi:DNA-binding MarR family transcriptional regulator